MDLTGTACFKRQQRAASSRASLALLASTEEGGCLGYICGLGGTLRASDRGRSALPTCIRKPQTPKPSCLPGCCLLPVIIMDWTVSIHLRLHHSTLAWASGDPAGGRRVTAFLGRWRWRLVLMSIDNSHWGSRITLPQMQSRSRRGRRDCDCQGGGWRHRPADRQLDPYHSRWTIQARITTSKSRKGT